ncbi:MAG: hypothetical protein JEZ05_10010 [Tenericutes bacterium]|nr:hypothetical protein [Mycoplasmatota bacterium]
MNILKIQNELNGFKSHLKDNHYSKHVVPVYIRKVKTFFKQKEDQIFEVKTHLKLKKIIDNYLKELPITSQSSLIQADVDISTIAILLGHESIETTHKYMIADLKIKENALSKLQTPDTKNKNTKYRVTEDILKFLNEL